MKVTVKPHQERVADSLDSSKGKIVYHGLGSGKTITAINAAEKRGGAVVIVPASLRANFRKELDKVGAKGSYKILSYTKFANSPFSLKGKLVILDEAHQIRNSGTKRSQVLREHLKEADKVLLLTATPIQNKPHEISTLINSITRENTLPVSEPEFKKKYIDTVLVPAKTDGLVEYIRSKLNPTKYSSRKEVIKNKEAFRRAVKGAVDYYSPPKDSGDFPEVSEEIIETPLSEEQSKTYRAWSGKLNPLLAYKIKNRLPPSKKEAGNLNSFLNAVRQLANTSSNFDTAAEELEGKLRHVAERLENTDKPALVYSNYINSGLVPVY